MTEDKNPINIFIIGSNGITIGENSKVEQKYGEAIDISSWNFFKKLAFAYFSGKLDRLPYQVENEVEYIDMEAASILDNRFFQLKKSIEESQSKISDVKNLLPTEISGLLEEWIAPITKDLEDLSAKHMGFRNAFFNLQKRLENEGFPKEILIEGKDISVEGDDLLLVARTFINNDRVQEAIRIIKRYLSNNPDKEDANLMLIEALILTRNYNEVIKWVLDHDDLKKNLEIRMLLIVAYQQTGDFKSARNEFSLFSKEHPDSAQVIKLQKAMGY